MTLFHQEEMALFYWNFGVALIEIFLTIDPDIEVVILIGELRPARMFLYFGGV